jgi:RTA1 like protein
VIFGRDISRIPPGGYTRLFIPCDIFSLVLQGTGGGMASVASQNGKDPKSGDNIMIAGLSTQVFTMALFIVLSAEYGWRVLKRFREQGSAGLDPTHAKLRNSIAFKGFLAALILATLCIFARCVFRVAELAGGWRGPLMKNQRLFIGLEGVMVIVAALVLVAFHPGLCFKAGYEVDDEKQRSGEDSVE